MAPTGRTRTILLTVVAMIAFAANSILGRLALKETGIDPATYTFVRIASGALMLAALRAGAAGGFSIAGSWRGAAALFVYAATFSFAYLSLSAGDGALLLFGAVQATMVIVGLLRGERLTPGQWLGLALALIGLVMLVAPGVTAPPLVGAILMLSAGVAWGAYSLFGLRGGDPLAATAGNFIRAAPLAAALALAASNWSAPPPHGLAYAALSGAVTSGLGYAVWYAALRGLSAAEGAAVQLSVPALAALGGAALLAEPPTLRLALSSIAVLGGIGLVIASRAGRRAR